MIVLLSSCLGPELDLEEVHTQDCWVTMAQVYMIEVWVLVMSDRGGVL